MTTNEMTNDQRLMCAVQLLGHFFFLFYALPTHIQFMFYCPMNNRQQPTAMTTDKHVMYEVFTE